MSPSELRPEAGTPIPACAPLTPPTSLTVGNAKSLYAKYGLSLYSDDVHLAELVRQSDWKLGISNSNYLHALALTDVMFRETKTAITIFTGPECGSFLECIADSFCSALERVRNTGHVARVIMVGTDSDAEHGLELRQRFGGLLKVVFGVLAKPEVPIDHFLICDGRMVRHEEPHGRISDEDDAGKIKAKVFFNNPIKARILQARFDSALEILVG